MHVLSGKGCLKDPVGLRKPGMAVEPPCALRPAPCVPHPAPSPQPRSSAVGVARPALIPSQTARPGCIWRFPSYWVRPSHGANPSSLTLCNSPYTMRWHAHQSCTSISRTLAGGLFSMLFLPLRTPSPVQWHVVGDHLHGAPGLIVTSQPHGPRRHRLASRLGMQLRASNPVPPRAYVIARGGFQKPAAKAKAKAKRPKRPSPPPRSQRALQADGAPNQRAAQADELRERHLATVNEAVLRHAASMASGLAQHGFVVVDHFLPDESIAAMRAEAVALKLGGRMVLPPQRPTHTLSHVHALMHSAQGSEDAAWCCRHRGPHTYACASSHVHALMHSAQGSEDLHVLYPCVTDALRVDTLE